MEFKGTIQMFILPVLVTNAISASSDRKLMRTTRNEIRGVKIVS